jgi:Tfp pilus assembly protein PilF
MGREINMHNVGKRWGWLGLVALFACGGPASQPAVPTGTTVQDPAGDEADAEAMAEGEEAIKTKDFVKAKAVFSAIVARKPDHPKANHYLAVALENLGDAQGAEKHYRAALAAAPSWTDSVLNLSALLIDSQRFEEAEKVLASSASRNPKDAALQLNLAYARMGNKDIEGAKTAFESALALADSPDVRLGLADLLVESGKYDEAKAHIDRAVQQAPENLEVLTMAAELYRKARLPDDCIVAYDKAIALRAVSQLFSNRGVCKQMKKDNAGAKADYKKAIETDPAYAPAHFLFGRFLLTVEKNKKAAIEAFEACEKIAPDSKCKQAAEEARR